MVKIITRHAGLVEWLKRKGIVGDVIAQATKEDVLNNDVVGVLPLNLACYANQITTVDMNLPLDKRGVDISPEEMDLYGAKLSTYSVTKIK